MPHPHFIDSFRYAMTGIATALRQERNLRFHLCVTGYVFFFSRFYHFDKTQYALLTLLVCGVMALELVNSSLERTVDRPSPERYQSAGTVKDMAAGAVLVFSIGAAVCGALLFWDILIFGEILRFFIGSPVACAAFAASLVCAGWFVFGAFRKRG